MQTAACWHAWRKNYGHPKLVLFLHKSVVIIKSFQYKLYNISVVSKNVRH